MNFSDIRATVLLQSYVIMSGGRLQETENKRICQISGPKVVAVVEEIYVVVSYERVFKTVFDWETKQNSNKTVYL